MRLPQTVSTICFLLLARLPSASAAEPVDFVRDVRPILSDKCFQCHGPDENAREGDLRLDLESAAREVLSPGKPAASELLKRVTSPDSDHRMPPPESNRTLSKTDIDILSYIEIQNRSTAIHNSVELPQCTLLSKAAPN